MRVDPSVIFTMAIDSFIEVWPACCSLTGIANAGCYAQRETAPILLRTESGGFIYLLLSFTEGLQANLIY